MTDIGDIPLTFGQLSVWRATQALPEQRRAEANVPRVWPVPPEVTPAQIAAAWRGLVARHDSLRTLFVPDGSHGLRQRVGKDDPGWEPIPIPLNAASPEALWAALTDLAAEPMDLATEYGWRVGYTDRTVDGARHILVVVHHILADGWSFDQLHREFMAALAGAPVTEPGLSPALLVEEQAKAARASRRQAAVDYVSRCLAALPDRTASLVPDSGRRIQAEFTTPAGQRALLALADRIGVSAQSVLLAMTAVGLHRVWEGQEVKVMLMSANRADQRWQPLITSMNQGVPLPITRALEHQTFTELARTIHGQSLRAYCYGIYDVDAVTARLAPSGVDQFAFGSLFNFMAYDLAPQPADGVERDLRSVETRRHAGPRFDIKIYSTPALRLCVRVDPVLMPEDQLHGLLNWYECELVRLAADPEQPLRSMP